MTGTEPAMSRDGALIGGSPLDFTPAWRSVGQTAGYFAAAAFLVQSILYLLDGTGILAAPVGFQSTAAGLQQDLAVFYQALNERQHHIWWSIAVRDTLGPLGYLSLMVLVVSVHRVAGRRHPRDELAVLFTIVGGSAAAASDLVYASQVGAWRYGFQATPDIVAFGRASEILHQVVNALQYAGFVVLAIAFVGLAGMLRSLLPRRRAAMALVPHLAAGALLAYIVSEVVQWDVGHVIATVLAGMFLGPALAIILGQAVKPHASRADPGATDWHQPGPLVRRVGR